MRVPRVQGVIRRRILVNFRVNPEVMQRQLPQAFRPKLLGGWAVAGICLIRLEELRPSFLPFATGLSSENAAHRVAVCWTDGEGVSREGVYIPRRDSNSFFNHLVGGRLFPGEHHRAVFRVHDGGDDIDFEMRSADGEVAVDVRGRCDRGLPASSKFSSVEAASEFFQKGSLGYSETAKRDQLEGLTLVTKSWSVQPLAVTHVHSSYFSDAKRFPPGSVEFDCALLMRNIQHEWVAAASLPRSPLATPAPGA